MWKLSEGGYAVRKDGVGYIVTAPDGAESMMDDLARLIEYADAVYGRIWTGRRITPSA